ncbi:rhomboid family intramembrane serine protease [Myxococcota bacterium]|nr:rhomboid family intramembrane serine protease [Myxococcota bacterium]MBU1537673.1 rhomboid family intramembrane serine protease [Myxococcota bacterium]
MFHFLLLFVLINLGFLIWGRSRRGFFRDPVYNGILGVDAVLALYSFTNDTSGNTIYTWLALGIFVGAVIIPLILGRLIAGAFVGSNLNRVHRLLQLKYLFQPSVDVAEQIAENKKYLKAYNGEINEITREIDLELSRSTDPLQTQFLLESLVEIKIFAGQWAEGIRTYRKRIGDPEKVLKPSFFVTLARAAIEAGEWDLLWEAYGGLVRLSAPLEDPLIRKSVFYVQVMVLAAYGRSGTLKKLFHPLKKGDPLFPLVPKRYWYGLSLMSAGKDEAAREMLDFPTKFKDMAPSFYQSALDRRAGGFVPPPEPDLTQRLALSRIKKELEHVSREKPSALATPWVGKGLIIFTSAVFAYQLYRMGMTFEFKGVEQMKGLFWIGGNFRHRSIAYGEYWRLFTSIFLHGGFIHVFFNLYVIWMFAPLLEVHYGKVKFFLIAVFSGVIGNIVSTLINPNGVAVGISGVVFGLVGAMFIMLIIHRDRFPQAWRKRQLSMLVFLLLINVVIGLSMEIIDNSAHGGGLVGGMVLALLLGGHMDRRIHQRLLTVILALATVGVVVYSAWGVYSFNQNPMKSPFVLEYSSPERRLRVMAPKFWELEYLKAENIPVAPGHAKPQVPFLYDPFCPGVNRLIFFTGEEAKIQFGQVNQAFTDQSRGMVGKWSKKQVRVTMVKNRELYFYSKELAPGQLVLIQVVYDTKCAKSIESVLAPMLADGGISGVFPSP